MSRMRPTLRTVTTVLLLWQLAAALLFTGPAMAATHASMHMSGATSHCHASHGASHDAVPESGTAHLSHSHHSTAPDCCLGASACHCSCAQGGVAHASLPASSDAAPGRVLEPDFRSPPFVARTTEVFRPPI